jgi:hypothetical protein
MAEGVECAFARYLTPYDQRNLLILHLTSSLSFYIFSTLFRLEKKSHPYYKGLVKLILEAIWILQQRKKINARMLKVEEDVRRSQKTNRMIS